MNYPARPANPDRLALAAFRKPISKGNDMIQAIGESTALAVRGYEEQYQMPGGRLRKSAADRVAMPTRHDGKRYRRLAKLDRAAEVYAAWCLILGVAARCPKPGVLVDEQGEALSAQDLADMTGFPSELFELGIKALLDERIGWLMRVPLGSATESEEATEATESEEKRESDRPVVIQAPALEAGSQGVPETERAENRSFSFARAQSRAPMECQVPPPGEGDRGGPDAVGAPDASGALETSGTASFSSLPNFGFDEPIGDSETRRIDDIEEALFHLSLLGQVPPELYRSKEVTDRVIYELWLKLDADKGIPDPREVFVEHLKKRISGEQGGSGQ